MPQTPNHGYNVPNEGDEDWHEPLNENFEAYDTDIEIRDEQANVGTYEPRAGAKFLATDTEAVYVGDGSSWQKLQTSGRSPTFQDRRVRQVGAKATLSGIQSVPDDSRTAVAFDDTVWDDRSEFDASNNEFVAQNPGRYHAIAQLSFDLKASDADSEFVVIEIVKNGFTVARTHLSAGAPGQFPNIQCNAHLDLQAGDTVGVVTRHQSGDPADLFPSEDDSFLSVVRLG